MKVSELWLREWIGSEPARAVLCERLTMAGLEIEEISAVAGEFSGVVVACIEAIQPHPEADRLRICQVRSGEGAKHTIVCGAPNVFVGMKAPLARIGAKLPGGLTIKASKLRGVLSEGMLCSAKELGLAEDDGRGLLVLSEHAPVGDDLRDYLKLDDHVIDLSITPNRGDCLSIEGLSTEIAALTGYPAQCPVQCEPVPQSIDDVFPVEITESSACARYVGRIIKNIRPSSVTPVWMQERLRRAAVRCISAVVDIMNYVMLELGQPMHAFDFNKLSKGIWVRNALDGEKLTLLDESTVQLDTDTLVIADAAGPLAVAGVMGGMDSAVSDRTHSVFLESAFFQPDCVARAVRTYQLGSESSHRFERGVDPQLQKKAIERATALILEIAGGEAGPVIDVKDPLFLPKSRTIFLRAERLSHLAGISFDSERVVTLLSRCGFAVNATGEGWEVTVPARRFDMTREVDLIEEVLRLNGYENIPVHFAVPRGQSQYRAPAVSATTRLADALSARGYHEVITYSFVDQKCQALFSSSEAPDIELLNPITSTMSVMRKNLWPGLVSALQYNFNRQQNRVRFYETGKRFLQTSEGICEQSVVSGLAAGPHFPLQWGAQERETDFFDIKGDIEYLITSLGLNPSELRCLPVAQDGLHPGQTGHFFYGDELIGQVGALHPKVLQVLDLTGPIFVFEFLVDKLSIKRQITANEISKFPSIRRDLSILVDSAIPASAIQGIIMKLGDSLLQSVTIFDVYQGKGVAQGKKSMALALVMQHPERTLTDEEISERMQCIVSGLQESFGAELRG